MRPKLNRLVRTNERAVTSPLDSDQERHALRGARIHSRHPDDSKKKVYGAPSFRISDARTAIGLLVDVP